MPAVIASEQLFMVARKSQKQESREEECQQLGMGGLSSTLQGNVTEQKYPRFTWGSLRCNGTFPGGYWVGWGTNVR